MIVEYSIDCYQRTLKIDIIEWWKDEFKDYPIIKDLPSYIEDVLNEYYCDWTESNAPVIYQTPLEEYMMGRLEEDYGRLWSNWESIDWEVE